MNQITNNRIFWLIKAGLSTILLLYFALHLLSCDAGTTSVLDILAQRENKQVSFFSNHVLALYKSTDNFSADKNEILYHVAPVLKEMGFSLTYWDVDQGVPDINNFSNVRFVISWFKSSSMGDPEAYLDFVDSVIYSGRKFIVFDNFGAYQRRASKSGEAEYIKPERINLTLSKLGLYYMGAWTDDPESLEVAYVDRDVVGGRGFVQDIKPAFYYNFLSVDKNLQIFLSVKRKDKDTDPSPLVVVNKNGAFAFSTYIYTVENKKIKMIIDLKKFLSRAIFPSYQKEQVALLVDFDDQAIRELTEKIEELLTRVKIPYHIITNTEFPFIMKGDLNRYSTLFLVSWGVDTLDPDILKDYLNAGGSLVCIVGGRFDNLAPFLASKSQPELMDKARKGYHFKNELIFSQGLELKIDNYNWQSGALLPQNDAVILGTDSTGKNPLVWSSSDRHILVWNWNGFVDEVAMGLIIESMLYVRPVGVVPILGFAHLFIDDWPLPMYNIKKEPMPDITDTEFYTSIWWQDMEEILNKYSVPYSSYMIFNYNDKVNPPFTGSEFYAAADNASVAIGHKLFNEGADVGLHGYNHQSLTTEETEVNIYKWPSIKEMQESLYEGRRIWISHFGEHTLPFCYVACNNIIDKNGIRALHKVFPSIKIVSALHWGIGESSFTAIGPDPEIQGIYYLPRISYGYEMTPEIKELLFSGMAGPGLFSHFIHPDDVYDPERSGGKSWSQLKKDFIEILSFMQKHYPWLQWVDIRTAYMILLDNDMANYVCIIEDKAVKIYTEPGIIIRVRLNGNKLKNIEGADILYQYDSTPYLIIKTTGKHVRIEY